MNCATTRPYFRFIRPCPLSSSHSPLRTGFCVYFRPPALPELTRQDLIWITNDRRAPSNTYAKLFDERDPFYRINLFIIYRDSSNAFVRIFRCTVAAPYLISTVRIYCTLLHFAAVCCTLLHTYYLCLLHLSLVTFGTFVENKRTRLYQS